MSEERKFEGQCIRCGLFTLDLVFEDYDGKIYECQACFKEIDVNLLGNICYQFTE